MSKAKPLAPQLRKRTGTFGPPFFWIVRYKDYNGKIRSKSYDYYGNRYLNRDSAWESCQNWAKQEGWEQV